MITYVVSDIFYSPAKVLVNTVNTVGAMGKGLAYQFRQFYPPMYDQYRQLCEQGQFSIGQLWLYKTPHKWILNFPTKADWRDPSRLEYLEQGLQKFVETYAAKGLTSVSFPMLGAGLGGLDWETMVRPVMERYLHDLPINIYIHLYEPDNPFALKSDFKTQKSWLDGLPQVPTFTRFRDEVLDIVRHQSHFETLDEQSTFSASLDEFEERITLHAANGDSLTVLSESSLSDLWHYLHVSGYCLPQNLPSGLDQYAPQIVTLLAQLDYIHPVYVSRMQGQRRVGLHFIPPTSEAITAIKVSL